MPTVFCCGKQRSCDVYKLENIPGTILNYAYFVEACPVCGHTILVLKRYDPSGRVYQVRKKNVFARKLFEKIKTYIIFKLPKIKAEQGGKTYFHYNEFGKIRKCYSNLSSLKIGLFEILGHDLAVIPKKIQLPKKPTTLKISAISG